MAGLEAPLMMAWQAHGRDEGGGRRRGQQGARLGSGRARVGALRGPWGEGTGWGCLLCSRVAGCACVSEGSTRKAKGEEKEKEGKEEKKFSNLKISEK
jgi:hypothetical protein